MHAASQYAKFLSDSLATRLDSYVVGQIFKSSMTNTNRLLKARSNCVRQFVGLNHNLLLQEALKPTQKYQGVQGTCETTHEGSSSSTMRSSAQLDEQKARTELPNTQEMYI